MIKKLLIVVSLLFLSTSVHAMTSGEEEEENPRRYQSAHHTSHSYDPQQRAFSHADQVELSTLENYSDIFDYHLIVNESLPLDVEEFMPLIKALGYEDSYAKVKHKLQNPNEMKELEKLRDSQQEYFFHKALKEKEDASSLISPETKKSNAIELEYKKEMLDTRFIEILAALDPEFYPPESSSDNESTCKKVSKFLLIGTFAFSLLSLPFFSQKNG